MSTNLTEAKMAIVETLKADAGIIAEFTAANVDYGEPRNLDLETVVKRINVWSFEEGPEKSAVLTRQKSDVNYKFFISASFSEHDPKVISDAWEHYNGLIKDALGSNQQLLRGGIPRAVHGITWLGSIMLTSEKVDTLHHVVIRIDAKHRIVEGARV